MSPLFSYETEAWVRAAVPQSQIIQGFPGGHLGYQLITAPRSATSPFATHSSPPLKHFYCSGREAPWNSCDRLVCVGPAAPAWRWPGQGLCPVALQLLSAPSSFLGVEVSTKSAALRKHSSWFLPGRGKGAVAALSCRRAWLCFANNPCSSRTHSGPPHCSKSSAAPTWSGPALSSCSRRPCGGHCTAGTPRAAAGTRQWRLSSGSGASPACRRPGPRSCPASEGSTRPGSPGTGSTVRAAASCSRKCSRKNLGVGAETQHEPAEPFLWHLTSYYCFCLGSHSREDCLETSQHLSVSGGGRQENQRGTLHPELLW